MTKPIRVLIVEDDKRIAEINHRFVARVPGYEVIGIATNEQEGKELITVLQPELVLLDIYFPDMHGLHLLKWIREHFMNIDVIMITAAREVDSLKKAMHGGVFDYIIKPIMLERFTETLVRYKEYYDKMQRMMKEKEIISQEEIDELIRRDYVLSDADDELPKGIHRLTLEKVLTVMKQYHKGMTAEEVGKLIGASRTTTRRYLEYLVSVSIVIADVSYGTVGRPERIYRLKRS
ncbi:response regulator [Anoxybacillus flavithermus]|uniref:Transcriptional regulatory protein n=1 Tax=Anoxybacillus flavithermus TaxID=33934 RepID=A0A2G5RNQ8_9BACL|nr:MULTISPECIES: response regulator [Anoxybacillus]KFZ43719.1 chemotaxis protein CheY [Anoxybacillus sp. KU2-6(11)]PIC04353.1 response regulator [Anoxybacillus flavithermus]